MESGENSLSTCKRAFKESLSFELISEKESKIWLKNCTSVHDILDTRDYRLRAILNSSNLIPFFKKYKNQNPFKQRNRNSELAFKSTFSKTYNFAKEVRKKAGFRL
jgi:hypothetical protein